MEEKREPLSEMAIERKIQILRNKHMDSEVIALVKSDYEYGLTDDEIGLYLNKSYDIEQMRWLLSCITPVREIICPAKNLVRQDLKIRSRSIRFLQIRMRISIGYSARM